MIFHLCLMCLFVAELQSVEAEAAEGVFADAAEVEGVVVFDDVGDLGKAVGGTALEIFDDAAGLIERDDEGITLGRGLEKLRETSRHFAQEWMWQQPAVEEFLSLSHKRHPKSVATV